MSIGYWSIRNPWNTCVALDEFGAGTLDGNPADGSSYDACGPAAIENAIANLELRAPTYTNIGHMRADMIAGGQWTSGATISNPRTNGCVIGNIAWEIPRRKYQVLAFGDYTDAVKTESEIRQVLSTQRASIWIVTNAQALAGNEQNVHGHFVVIAGYGGDNNDGSTGKLYILNSDIAGQHGTATGQWTPISQFISSEPHGYVVFAPVPPAPNPEIVAAQSILTTAGMVISQITTIQAAAQKILDSEKAENES